MKYTYLLSIPLLLMVACGAPEKKSEEKTKTETVEKSTEYSPYVGDYKPNRQDTDTDRPLFGDTHLHTKLSLDAGFFGNRLGVEAAYRFARGEELESSTGVKTKLIRPLDFLVIADHGMYYGLTELLETRDPSVMENEVGKRWADWYAGSEEDGMKAFFEALASVQQGKMLISNEGAKGVWQKAADMAEKYNEPGTFTAFNGYEWSTNTDGNNVHRVVMFRDGADRVKQIVPFSLMDSEDVEDLWDFMKGYEEKTGGMVQAIPHNGNWSNGNMFSLTRVNGSPVDKAYAESRMHWEPVYEVTQMKGDGEAHPYLSPNDEFADFGTWDKGNIGGVVAKTNDMLQYEYGRSALRMGLEQEEKLGANPFKFGMVGSTDAHTSLATTREDNNFGKTPSGEPNDGRLEHEFMKGQEPGTTYYTWETLASGLAAVWATENTREAIWDAFKRKEVYATTGSRLSVRVFGGWDFNPEDVKAKDFADRGYAGGVPMGGDLNNAPEGKAPTFIVQALRDVENANLDRVQIIKGWVNAEGTSEERIYDLAVSDDRTINEEGRCTTPVGNTVEGTTYTNTIGASVLTACWTDPDFVASQRAFYYVRVIEIPKPSWQAYDAAFYGLTPSAEIPMELQDRAYTSPIWYTPK